MAEWTTRARDASGGVFFRGSLPPRIENFSQLAAAHVTVEVDKPSSRQHWLANITHPHWGKATVSCHREFLPPPPILLKFDHRLSEADRQAAALAGNSIQIRIPAAGNNILRGRKTLLRFLRLFMGDDGLITVDGISQKFWPRVALDEELSHDAELDIDSLFVSHFIYDDKTHVKGKPRESYWLHTHGLAELGAPDFDVLRPAPALNGNAYDTVRAIAYTLLKDGPVAIGKPFQLVRPGGPFQFVSIDEFNQRGLPADLALRGDKKDPTHNTDRVMICEPVGKPRFFGLIKPHFIPSRTLSELTGDRMMVMFPTSATNLMARRAQQTFQVFRAAAAEFAEFEVKPTAKLGYRIDGGDTDNREHMWFEVHGFTDDSMDATLMNQPARIASMKAGDRGHHSVSMLTDWMLFTPAGTISPRSLFAARILREKGPEIRNLMAEKRKKQS